MKHPLPPTLPRTQFVCVAMLIALLCMLSVPAAAQDENHHRIRHEPQAVLHIHVHIVPYTIMPRHHHKDDNGDNSVRFNMPSLEPKMTVIEQTRDLNATETTVKLGPEGAVLKTLTIVPE